MKVDEAFELLRHAIESGHPAHGYLLVGGVRGMAGELADRVLALLFGAGDLSAHPDIHRLSPEKKSRIISVESVRERLVNPMDQTAYGGGWKVGVVYGVDRLQAAGANAFLKTLEEPPPKTLFLLLTDRPEQLLPTIISRCQRIELPDARARALAEPYRTTVLKALARDDLRSCVARAGVAGSLVLLLGALQAQAEALVRDEVGAQDDGPGEEVNKDAFEALVSSRYREFRTDLAATVLSWFRDLMALVAAPPSHSGYDEGGCGTPLVNEAWRSVLESRASKLSLAVAMRNIAAVEEFAASLERNMSEDALLAFLVDRLQFGVENAR